MVGYLAGMMFIVAGVTLAVGQQVELTAIVVSVCFLVRAALYYLPELAISPRDPRAWTGEFELLAISGASLILAATLNMKSIYGGRNLPDVFFQSGRVLFACSLLVFGIQHLMYGGFIAGLIPGWLPGHLFWAYFVGVAFLAAALAIVSGKFIPLTAALLGVMFLLWVLMLHGPRVAGALHNANEWTSLFVALAMSGGSFVIAGAMKEKIRGRSRLRLGFGSLKGADDKIVRAKRPATS